jgi:hypothetical protein
MLNSLSADYYLCLYDLIVPYSSIKVYYFLKKIDNYALN